MIVQKTYAFLLALGLIFQTVAFAAAAPTTDLKDDESAPKLKQNAFKLLLSVARETGQFNVPENRIRAGTIVACLLWEHDERAARAIYQNIFAELQNLFGSLNLPAAEELSRNERNEDFFKRYRLGELRRDYVLTLAPHDPQAALAALAALKTEPIEEYDPLDTKELELQIASAIAKKDSDRAYALVKDQITADGISYPVVEALKDLYDKNPRLASNLGRDVLGKIRNAKIRVPTTGESSATPNTNTDSQEAEIDFWQIATFINAATEMNRYAARHKEKKMQPFFADAEMRELVDLTARALLNASNPLTHSIGQIMPEITLYAPAQGQRIRLKIGTKAASELDNAAESAAYHRMASKEKSADELARDAERAAPNLRDQRYADAASKALEENEPEKAKVIFARIKESKNYAYLFEQIEADIPLAKARRGDPAEVRKMLAALKTNQERIAVLTELAAALAAKGENETAKKLLDDSLRMLTAPLKNQSDLESVGKIAAIYAAVAPAESFTMVETGIAQMNEYIAAAIKLDDFYDIGSVEKGELRYEAMYRQLLLNFPNSIDLLKNLAKADFDRTVGLADKFERPEIRLLVRVRILQSLLDSEAVEKEKKDRKQFLSEQYEH